MISKKLVLGVLIFVTIWAACRPADGGDPIPPESAAVTLAGGELVGPTVTAVLSSDPIASAGGNASPIDLEAIELVPLPEDYYLLIEWWEDRTGRGTCEPRMLIDEPLYDFTCTDLEGERMNCEWKWSHQIPYGLVERVSGAVYYKEDVDENFAGLLGIGESMSGHGGGVSAILVPIAGLPFQTERAPVEILGLLPDGALAATIRGKSYALPVGGSWVRLIGSEVPDQPACEVTVTERLTYFGLLRSAQLSLGFDLGERMAAENP